MPNTHNFDADMQATRDEAQSATGFQSTVKGDVSTRSWSDALALYAPLVESEILSRLEWYQPTANHSRHVFAWRYMPQCGYPHTAIPDDTVWENPQKSSPDPVLDSLLDSRGNIRVG